MPRTRRQQRPFVKITPADDRCFGLAVSDRVEELVGEIPEPALKWPSVFLVLGRRRKRRLINAVFNIDRGDHDPGLAQFHAHVDPYTIFSDRPRVVIDGDLAPRCPASDDDLDGFTVDQVTEQEGSSSTAFVCARLLAPFVNVVCVCFEDYVHHDTAILELSKWTVWSTPMDLHRWFRPHLVVVVGVDDVLTGADVKSKLTELAGQPWSVTFSNVTVVRANSHVTASTEFPFLEVSESLLRISHEASAVRKEMGYLFHVCHLFALLRRALRHPGRFVSHPVDFISHAREERPVSDDLSRLLSDFLSNFSTSSGVRLSAVPLIASSMLLDHYLPGMHRFPPDDVFRRLYREPCRQLSAESGMVDHGHTVFSPNHIARLVERKFVQYFRILEAIPTLTAADIHWTQVASRRGLWRRIHTSRLCLLCLFRTPASPSLGCGHWLCGRCWRARGQPASMSSDTVIIRRCPLCDHELEATHNVVTHHAPPRILSLDGGGLRVAIGLEFLQMLDESVGVPHFSNRCFDLVGGTSVGGLAALGMFQRGWSPALCRDMVDKLGRDVFPRRRSCPVVCINWLVLVIATYVHGGIYSCRGIDDALKQVFGADRRLNEASWATEHGVKIVLPMVCIPGNKRYLANNYNATGDRPVPCGYRLLSSGGGATGGDVAVWEVARCISAAPGFFKPHRIEVLDVEGSDGALWDNNPVRICMREGRAVSGGEDPRFVLSIGTGSASSVQAPTDQSWLRKLLQNTVVGQMYDYLTSSLSSQITWEEFVLDHPRLHQQGRLLRCDLEFAGPAPRLDAVACTEELRRQVRATYHDSEALRTAKDVLCVNMFYFVLDEDPVQARSGRVRGRLLCHWKPSQQGFAGWRDYVTSALTARVLVNGRHHGVILTDRHGHLTCPVTVPYRNLHDRLSIQIELSVGRITHLGGSPFTVQELRRRQKFTTEFGHDITAGRKRPGSPIIDSRARKYVRYTTG